MTAVRRDVVRKKRAVPIMLRCRPAEMAIWQRQKPVLKKWPMRRYRKLILCKEAGFLRMQSSKRRLCLKTKEPFEIEGFFFQRKKQPLYRGCFCKNVSGTVATLNVSVTGTSGSSAGQTPSGLTFVGNTTGHISTFGSIILQ